MAGRRANSAYMLLGQIVGKAGLFGSLMIYSRMYSDGEFGELMFAVAIGLILFFLSDMGASLVSTRRLVLAPDSHEPLSSALMLRTALSVLSSLVLVGSVILMGYGRNQALLLYMVFAGFVLDGFFESFYALFRARDRMVFEGLARSLQGVLSVAVALVIRTRGLGYMWAGASYPIRSALPFLMCFLAAGRMEGWGFLKPAKPSSVLELLRSSLPLGVMGFVLVAGQRFDNTLVKAFLSDSAVAAWQQCYRLFEPMVLLVAPTLLPGALFADLCRAEKSGWKPVAERISWMTEVFTIMAFMIVIPLFFMGMDVLRVVWGEGYLRDQPFTHVQSALRILMFCLPVTYVFHVFLAVILAQGKQKKVLLPAVSAFLLQLAGLFLFLERAGIAAAAVMQLLFITVLTVWLGISAFRKHGTTGFLTGIRRPAAALVPFMLLAVLQPFQPAFNTAISLFSLLLVWAALGGGRAVTRPPLSISSE